MMKFKFELNQVAVIEASGEAGTIIARAEYAASENMYYLRYKAANGSAQTAWWEEGALKAS